MKIEKEYKLNNDIYLNMKLIRIKISFKREAGENLDVN